MSEAQRVTSEVIAARLRVEAEAEAQRAAEAKRKAAAEAARVAEEQRQAEEAARVAEEQRQAEEAARVAEEQRQAKVAKPATPRAPKTAPQPALATGPEPDPVLAPVREPPSADELLHATMDPTGIRWGYDCGGTGPGVVAMAVRTDPLEVCFRSSITAARARFVALHEIEHVKLYRILDATRMTLPDAEARLGVLFDTTGLRKPAGQYPHLEIVADCGVYLATGGFDPGAYTYVCDGARLGAARAIDAGQMP